MTNPLCPNCNNKKTTLILYGYFGINEELEKKINDGEIALGGCLVTEHDPKWECNKCMHQWGERDD